MTALAFDLVVAALLLLAAWRGYRTGFILTLCGFLAIFVAFIGATMVSNSLSTPVSRIIQPVVEHNIQQVFLQNLPNGTEVPDASGSSGTSESSSEIGTDSSQSTVEVSLQEALNLLKDSSLYKGFADAFQKVVNDGMVSATVNAARSISDYVSKQIAQLVLFFVSFVLILVLWFFLSHALDLAFRLPVLSTLNHWSGAALGLLKGALLLFIACWLLKGSFLPESAIQNTYLLKFFCTVSPLTLLF
ncbi:MAG: CvpA family protein [Lawsonibacter sp.]|nr:CvpA family protein [Lawsonibacter sp.]